MFVPIIFNEWLLFNQIMKAETQNEILIEKKKRQKEKIDKILKGVDFSLSMGFSESSEKLFKAFAEDGCTWEDLIQYFVRDSSDNSDIQKMGFLVTYRKVIDFAIYKLAARNLFPIEHYVIHTPLTLQRILTSEKKEFAKTKGTYVFRIYKCPEYPDWEDKINVDSDKCCEILILAPGSRTLTSDVDTTIEVTGAEFLRPFPLQSKKNIGLNEKDWEYEDFNGRIRNAMIQGFYSISEEKFNMTSALNRDSNVYAAGFLVEYPQFSHDLFPFFDDSLNNFDSYEDQKRRKESQELGASFVSLAEALEVTFAAEGIWNKLQGAIKENLEEIFKSEEELTFLKNDGPGVIKTSDVIKEVKGRVISFLEVSKKFLECKKETIEQKREKSAFIRPQRSDEDRKISFLNDSYVKYLHEVSDLERDLKENQYLIKWKSEILLTRKAELNQAEQKAQSQSSEENKASCQGCKSRLEAARGDLQLAFKNKASLLLNKQEKQIYANLFAYEAYVNRSAPYHVVKGMQSEQKIVLSRTTVIGSAIQQIAYRLLHAEHQRKNGASEAEVLYKNAKYGERVAHLVFGQVSQVYSKKQIESGDLPILPFLTSKTITLSPRIKEFFSKEELCFINRDLEAIRIKNNERDENQKLTKLKSLLESEEYSFFLNQGKEASTLSWRQKEKELALSIAAKITAAGLASKILKRTLKEMEKYRTAICQIYSERNEKLGMGILLKGGMLITTSNSSRNKHFFENAYCEVVERLVNSEKGCVYNFTFDASSYFFSSECEYSLGINGEPSRRVHCTIIALKDEANLRRLQDVVFSLKFLKKEKNNELEPPHFLNPVSNDYVYIMQSIDSRKDGEAIKVVQVNNRKDGFIFYSEDGLTSAVAVVSRKGDLIALHCGSAILISQIIQLMEIQEREIANNYIKTYLEKRIFLSAESSEIFHNSSIRSEVRMNVLNSKIQNLREERLEKAIGNEALAMYVDLYSLGENGETERVQDNVDDFLFGTNNPAKVLLILGEAGSGKSTFALNLEKVLWKKWKENDIVPLYISLPSIKNAGDCIREFLHANDFSNDQIGELRQHKTFVFILDAYDEIDCNLNIYEANQLSNWTAKVIITCRAQYLIHKSEKYNVWFAPIREGKVQERLLRTISLVPFTPERTQEYLKKYVEVKNLRKSWQEYHSYITQIPELEELVETPFILNLLIELFPVFYERSQKEDSWSLFTIYEEFIKNSFGSEKNKAEKNKLPLQGDIIHAFWEASQSIASFMCKQKQTSISYEDILDVFREKSHWKTFFGEKPLDLFGRVFRALPLKKIAPKKYSFLHHSILEYFLTKEVMDAVKQISCEKESFSLAEKEGVDKMRTQNLLYSPIFTEQIPNINFLIDLAKENAFKDQLFYIVRESRNDPTLSTAAANAITILSEAKVSFSREKFDSVSIPGADLSQAILDGTDLRGSNLTGVKLQHAFLRNTLLQNSEMKGVQLGQLPYLSFPAVVSCVCVFPKDRYFAVACNTTIYIYELIQKEQQKNRARIITDHASNISCIKFSPSGLYLASSDCNGIIHIWKVIDSDLRKLKKIFVLSGHETKITNMAFAPMGACLASGSADNTVRLWKDLDVDKGLETRDGLILKQYKKRINAVSFSPTGRYFACGGNDQNVYLWEIKWFPEFLAEERATFQSYHDVMSIDFSPEGNYLVSGALDGNVRLWNLAANVDFLEESSEVLGDCGWSATVAFSPDGSYLAIGGQECVIQIWSFLKKKMLKVLSGHSFTINSIAYSHEGDYLISGSNDNTVRVWQLSDQRELQSGHIDKVCSVAFSSDGRYVASGGWDRRVYLWEAMTGKELKICLGHTGYVNKVDFYGKENNLFSAGWDAAYSWNGHTKTKRNILPRRIGNIWDSAFSSDGSYLSVGTKSNIYLWKLQEETNVTEIFVYDSASNIGSCVAFSPDSRKLASGGCHGNLLIWYREEEGEFIKQKWQSLQGHKGEIISIAFSPYEKSLSRKYLVSGSSNNDICIWDIEQTNLQQGDSLQPILTLPKKHTRAVTSLVFSLEGGCLISGSKDNMVHIWHINEIVENEIVKEVTVNWMQSITGHTNGVLSLTLSPDGKYLASGSEDHAVRLWELFDKKMDLNPVLKWTTTPILSCPGANIEGATLENLDKELLILHGAVDKRTLT